MHLCIENALFCFSWVEATTSATWSYILGRPCMNCVPLMGPAEVHNYIAIEWILYSTQSNCFKREKRWYHESLCVCTWYYYGLYTDLHSVCVVSTRYECGLTPSKSKLDDFPCGSKSKTLHNASEKQATAESRQAQRNRLTPAIELETSYCSVPSLIHFYLQKQTPKPHLPFF